MAIIYDKLRNWPFADRVDSYAERDCMLYALGLGYGSDPLDESELSFVHEKDTLVMPTMLAVVGAPNAWAANPETGINYLQLLHGEHRMTFHAPVKASASLRSKTRVSSLVDKGEGKGALVITQRDIFDEASGAPVASIEHVSFCRADGGFGAGDQAPAALPPTPDHAPDHVVELSILPQAALLYRLNGDWNQVHIQPSVARAAGFERPILHGLCTFGMAARALLRAACPQGPQQLKSFSTRFSAPIFPGETMRVEIWRTANGAHFRALSKEREKVVLSNGYAEIAGQIDVAA